MPKIEIPSISHQIMGNFSKIPNDLIRSPLLTPAEKIVCIVLLSYTPSFPSYERIMKDSNIGSKATIAKALRSLIRHRFIEIIPDSKYRSNLYKYIQHDYRKAFDLAQFNTPDIVTAPPIKTEIDLERIKKVSEMNLSRTTNELVSVQEVNSNKTNTTILNTNINGPKTPPQGSSGPVTETKETSTDFSLITKALESLDCKPNYFRKSEPKHTFII